MIKATQTRDGLSVEDQRGRVRGQPTARREQRLIIGRLKVILLRSVASVELTRIRGSLGAFNIAESSNDYRAEENFFVTVEILP